MPSSEPHHQFSLLKQRRFAGLFWVQFLGAFNDNLFKNALMVLVIYKSLSLGNLSAPEVVNVATGLFILPYLLFSGFGGQLADKFEKSILIRYVKLLEVFIMCCAAVGLLLESVSIMLLVLFLLGIQATLFGPVKYSFLPQNLAEQELIGGNGLVEMGTFVAILLGTILGSILIVMPHGALWVTFSLLAMAVFAYVVSYCLPISPANDPTLRLDWNIGRQIVQTMGYARRDHLVFLAIVGISWFWLYGAFILTQLPEYVKNTLGGSSYVNTLLLAVFSIGIGVGSVLCEKFSKKRLELGLVPFGSLGITLFGIFIYIFSPAPIVREHLIDINTFLHMPHAIALLICFAGISVFAGFYTVPLYALIQSRSATAYSSRIIAANNILNAIFIIASAILGIIFLSLHLTISQMILIISLLNAMVAIYIYVKAPEFLQSFISWLRE
jgi:MFS family permease